MSSSGPLVEQARTVARRVAVHEREGTTMFHSTARRRLVTLVVTVLMALGGLTSAASAGSMFFSKSSGMMAATSWLEVGELPPAANAPGNAHFGDLWVESLGRGRASAFGTVYDVQCEEGVTPYLPGGGHHEEAVADEPEEPGGCELLGVRFIEGGSLQFTINRKLTTATLTGTLSVGSGHGEGPVGSPPVNITWNGVGSLYKSTNSGSYTGPDGTYRYRYSFAGRDAVIATGSRIGPMVFDDEPGEWSTGKLGIYRSSERFRSR